MATPCPLPIGKHSIVLLLETLACCAVFVVVGCKPTGDTSPAGDFPQKTVTLLCPWAAGGGTDRLTRFMASELERELGNPCVVVNRTGGSGAVGHSAGALATPDGHTMTMATFELSTMHWMGISDLTWKDYAPILQLNADAAAVLVRSDAPWHSLNEFLDEARENPGTLTMSGTATGGAWDLARAGLLLKAGMGVGSIRWVPAQGAAPAIVELLGRHIDSVCCSIPEAIPQIEAGQLRALAVMSPARLDGTPEIPTAIESGIDWVAVGWRGLVLPKDTPAEIQTVLREACGRIVASAEFRTFMKKNGFTAEVRSGVAFGEFLAEQDSQWQAVIEAAGYAR